MDLVSQRAAAKEAKDWELADSLRRRITELGFAVKDVKGGGEPLVSRVEYKLNALVAVVVSVARACIICGCLFP